MNYGVLVYTVIELFMFGYVALLFFKMGQNRDQKYMQIRTKFAGTLALFNKDKVHFACAAIMIIVMILRIVETLGSF